MLYGEFLNQTLELMVQEAVRIHTTEGRPLQEVTDELKADCQAFFGEVEQLLGVVDTEIFLEKALVTQLTGQELDRAFARFDGGGRKLQAAFMRVLIESISRLQRETEVGILLTRSEAV